MSNHTNRATAAAAPVDVDLAGEQYKMDPLTVADHAEFDRYLQQRVIRMAREMITDDMSEREQERLMDAAFRRAEQTSMESPGGVKVANSLEGVSYLLWLGMRRHHPDLTPEKVKALLVDEQTVNAVRVTRAMDAFDLANGRRAASKKKRATKKKAKPRKSRSR